MAAAALPLFALSLAGGFISARGATRQAQAEARQAEAAAQEEERVTRERVDQLRRKRARLLSSQRAAITARGVKLSGSPLEILAETNEVLALDINRLRRQTQFRAGALRERGRIAGERGRTAAITSLIGSVAGGARVAGQFAAQGHRPGEQAASALADR